MTILCPLDFSASSPALVAYAATLAAGRGAQLCLLHVREAEGELSPGPEPGACLAHYQSAAERAGAAQVSTELLQGEAAPLIVAAAQRRQADLIVIGAQGQTGLTRFLMGHTAEVVIRTAPCATFLFRNPHPPKTGE